MDTGPSEVKTPKAPKTRKSLLLFAFVALGIASASAAAYYYLGANRPHKEVAKAPADPIFIALEPFTVNLQPNGRMRFLHVGLTLKMADAKSQSQVIQYLPEVRSRVLNVLSNREAESLAMPSDKALLASELMATLNQPFGPDLPLQKISSVMFTTFMLQ